MRRLLFLTIVLASLFALVNCNNYKNLTSQTEVLFRNKWILKELQGQPIPDSFRNSFEFTPHKITGTTDCNLMFAGFIAGKHQTVTIVPDTLTKRSTCPNENTGVMENKVLDALAKSTKWDINGGELWLGDGKATLVKLRSL